MRTLIVPCMGSRCLNGMPLYLNRHPNGKLLVLYCIEGVFPESFDRIVITVSDEHDRLFHASEKIMKELKGSFAVECCVLPKQTICPAETIYQTIREMMIEGEIAIRDSHAYVELDSPGYGNIIAGLDMQNYDHTIDNLREKSFIICNEQKHVLDVVEKHLRSDIVSVGYYGFEDSRAFAEAYDRLFNRDYPIEKLYVSHVISYLIGYGQLLFKMRDVRSFEDWSSLSAWQRIQKAYATYILDLDGLFGENGSRLTEEQIGELSEMSQSGVRFVGISSREESSKDYSELLASKGIARFPIVDGCSCSSVRSFIRSGADLESILLEIKK